MSRFFYIKSNVKTITDYRQTNITSVSSKEFKQSNFKFTNSSNFENDINQQHYSSFVDKDYIKKERNQNNPENSNAYGEMNFLTNYKNLKKFYENSPTFSSYNLQSKIIAANLNYDVSTPSPLRSNTSPNIQSFLPSFYLSDYSVPQNETNKRNQDRKALVRPPRTSYLENFERTQMLIRNNFMLNTNTNSYSVPNIHNTKIPAPSLNKSTYDANFGLNISPKTSFESSLSSSGIGIENEIGFDDYKLNVPYDELQVTHFREKTFNYAKLVKLNLNSNASAIGIDNQNDFSNFDSNEIKKRRGRNEKMSIVDSIIAKYQPDPSGDFLQSKSSDISSNYNNSSDFKRFRLDSDQEPNNTAFYLQQEKQQQKQAQLQQLKIQLNNQEEEIDQLSELSLGSQESIATSASTTPTSSPIKTQYNNLTLNNQNSASEILIDSKSTKQYEKSDEAVIISNGSKKMINLSEKLEKFRSTISIVRKTEEDFGDLLKSEEDEEETSSVKPSNSSELKELPAEALSEPSLIFNDQLQDEMHENDQSKNNNTKSNNEKTITNEENNHIANS